jgi:transmembrane sensor
MSPHSAQPNASEAQRLDAATHWLLRLREAGASEDDVMRWLEWCDADARNQQAFERVQELWQIAGNLAPEVQRGELRGVPGLLQQIRTYALNSWFGFLESLRDHRPAVAMGVVLIAVVAGAAAWNLRGAMIWQNVGDHELLAAAVAERVRHAQLSDGSRVQLAAKSTVAVQYTENERSLELKDGEAYFTVAPNALRPFVVTIGSVRVRAVGTAFNIRRAGERIVVTVAEGTVDVYQDSPQLPNDGVRADNRVRVDAGGEVAWDSQAAQAPVVASVNPAEALSWREGRLEYTDEPLGAVIADFNRYSKHQAVFTDDAIKQLRFTGTLMTEVSNEWIHVLPRLFPVMVRERNGTYVIEPLYTPREG